MSLAFPPRTSSINDIYIIAALSRFPDIVAPLENFRKVQVEQQVPEQLWSFSFFLKKAIDMDQRWLLFCLPLVGWSFVMTPIHHHHRTVAMVHRDDATSEAEELRKQVEALRSDIAVLEAEEAKEAAEEAAKKREAVQKREAEEPLMSQEAREILDRWEPGFADVVAQEEEEELPEEESVERPTQPAFLTKPRMIPQSLEDVNALFSTERCLSWCDGAQFWEASLFAEAMGLNDDFKVSALQVEKNGDVQFEASPAVHRFLAAGLPGREYFEKTPSLGEAQKRLKDLGFFTDIFDRDDFDVQGELLKTEIGQIALQFLRAYHSAQDKDLGFVDIGISPGDVAMTDPILHDMVNNKNLGKKYFGIFDRPCTVTGSSLATSLQKDGVATTGDLRRLFGDRIDEIGQFLWRRWRQGVIARRRSYLDSVQDENNPEDAKNRRMLDFRTIFFGSPGNFLKREMASEEKKKMKKKLHEASGGDSSADSELLAEDEAMAFDAFVAGLPLPQCFKLLEDPVSNDATVNTEVIARTEQYLLDVVANDLRLNSFEFDVANNRRTKLDENTGLEARWDAVRFAHRCARATAASLLVALDAVAEVSLDDRSWAVDGPEPQGTEDPVLATAMLGAAIMQGPDDNVNAQIKQRAEDDVDFRRTLALSAGAFIAHFFYIVIPGACRVVQLIALLLLGPPLFDALLQASHALLGDTFAANLLGTPGDNGSHELFSTGTNFIDRVLFPQDFEKGWWHDLKI